MSITLTIDELRSLIAQSTAAPVDATSIGETSILSKYLGQHVCVRSHGSGVWLGTLKVASGADVILSDARRVYYWDGAATLSELAQRGTSSPSTCKWPAAVSEVAVTSVLEVIPTTPEARATHAAVAVWSK